VRDVRAFTSSFKKWCTARGRYFHQEKLALFGEIESACAEASILLGVAKACDLIYIKAPGMKKQEDKDNAVKQTKKILNDAGLLKKLRPLVRTRLESC